MSKEFPFHTIEGNNPYELGFNYGKTLKNEIEKTINLYKGKKRTIELTR